MPQFSPPRHRLRRKIGFASRNLGGQLATGGRRFGEPKSASLLWLSQRSVRLVAIGLVLLALLVIGFRFFLGQQLGLAPTLERVARRQFIPQLEKQLGQKIEVGDFETDWLGRLVVRDITIGRNASLPTGAFARIKTATLNLDLVGLALRRVTPLQAIHGVTLDEPQVYLARNRRGQWNFGSLLKPQTGAATPSWTGTITIRDGRVYARDELTKNSAGTALVADATGLNAQSGALAGAPWQFDGKINQILLGPQKTRLAGVDLGGAYEVENKRGFVRTSLPNLPLPLLADYAFPQRETVVSSGTLGGNLVVAFAPGQLAPRGDLKLQNAAFASRQLLEPGTQTPVQFEKVSGALQFAGAAVRFSQLRGRALGADFALAGAASLGAKPVFDVRFASTNLPTSRLLRWVQNRPFEFSSAPLRLSARVSGSPQQFNARGALDTASARITSAQQGLSSSLNGARLIFAANVSKSASGQFKPRAALRLVASGLNAQSRQYGRIAAQGLVLTTNSDSLLAAGPFSLDVTARYLEAQNQQLGQLKARSLRLETSGALDNSQFNLTARSAGWNLISPQYGTTAGRDLSVVAVAPSLKNQRFKGQLVLHEAPTNRLNLGALSPQLVKAVRDSGTLSARIDFANLTPQNPKAADIKADFALSRLQLNRAALPASFASQIPASALGLNAIVGVASQSKGVLQVNTRAQSGFGPLNLSYSPQRVGIELLAARLAGRQLDVLLRQRDLRLEGDWRGRVSVAASPDASQVEVGFALTSEAATLRDTRSNGLRARIEAPTLRGNFGRSRDGYSGGAQLRAALLEVRGGKWGTTNLALPAQLSGARLADTRLDFVLENAVDLGAKPENMKWNARLDASRASFVASQVGPITLAQPALLVNSSARGINLDRLSARWGRAQLNGSARLQGQNVSAELLARNLDAATLQRLSAPSSLGLARVNGRLDALLRLAPGANPLVETHLTRGSLRFIKRPQVVALSGGSAQVELVANQAVIRNATLWSAGARITGDGTVSLAPVPSGEMPKASGHLAVRGLRITSLPISQRTLLASHPDGLIDGDFKLQTRADTLLEGQVTVRGASAFGASVEESKANLAISPSFNGLRLDMTNWTGTTEGAPFNGEVEADTGSNFWRVQVTTNEYPARRAALIQAGLNPTAPGQRALPVEGTILADVDVNGDLFPAPDSTGYTRPYWIPNQGYVRLFARDLLYKGRAVGTLNADFQVEPGLARIRTLELNPPASENYTPRVAVFGALPLSPRLPGLDLRVSVGEAPLDFFLEAVRESPSALQGIGVQTQGLERIISLANSLPSGAQGRVALDATLKGSWDAPQAAVSGFTLRDGRVPLPNGGFSPPALLTAAFKYDQGAFVVDTADFRLQKGLPMPTPAAPDEDDSESDDTIMRVAPGGRVAPDGDINLSADIFNANLEQLATWFPALRSQSGAPLLRGDISEFSIHLSGQTLNPNLIGSLQAENLSYNAYTLDRLRISRFEIADGVAAIKPGNLTIVRGSYQSSAASGQIPWDWKRRGPLFDEPIQIDFPLQTNDFGALAGFLVPALTNVEAKDFAGDVQVRGTLNEPKLNGNLSIHEGQFRLDSKLFPLPVGLTGLNGTVRFVENNRIEIAPDDPLSGDLVSPNSVEARSAQTVAERKNSRKKADTVPAVKLAGHWTANGSVNLNLDAATRNPVGGMSQHAYDLTFSLEKGEFSLPQISGFKNLDFAARWQTAADGAQRVRWMGAAEGARKNSRTSKTDGDILTLGQLQLPTNFATGLEPLLHSQAENFTGFEDFAAFPVAKRVTAKLFPDARPQFLVRNFAWAFAGVGSGSFDGRLVLDNRDAIQKLPQNAVTLQNAATKPQLQQSLRDDRAAKVNSQASSGKEAQLFESVYQPSEQTPTDSALEEPKATPDLSTLRLGGMITLQNSEIVGAPAGDGGLGLRLSQLPSAPRFDIRFVLGKNVNVVNTSLRARLEGELVAQGTPNDPQILGTVNTVEGQVRFPNARARVEEGRITLAINRDPETDLLRTRADVDVTARGQAGTYQITLRLRGPLDLGSGAGNTDGNAQKLNVEVTSNPPLSQDEAFAQLLGVSIRDYTRPGGGVDAGDANQAYARALLQVISAPLFSGVERSVAEALGLDSVNFEYRFDAPLTVALSKNFGKRVLVTYRRSLGGSRPGEPIPFELRVDYRVKGDFLVGIRSDERDVRELTVQKTWHF